MQGAGTPRGGWVKTVRLAPGMNSETLGRRLGISPQGVRRLEQSEAEGSIYLNILTKIADGLNCDVRYVLVPRISLVVQVMARAWSTRRGSHEGWHHIDVHRRPIAGCARVVCFTH
ncbi:helix-turn-helix domain-containing protein [Acidovorax sp. Root219]|uniref:helix-turn-helix domain-containing protein n=1 Tax=Acidovorax sp. Root219 TaxID=1736493 RepID=UPI0012F7925D|nr:helix-turn-helix domain-containing protein [Acidovorax sp. Root219]